VIFVTALRSDAFARLLRERARLSSEAGRAVRTASPPVFADMETDVREPRPTMTADLAHGRDLNSAPDGSGAPAVRRGAGGGHLCDTADEKNHNAGCRF